jgi:hypothetical protein
MQVKKAYREHIKNRIPGPFIPEKCKFPEFINRPHARSKLLKDYVRRLCYLYLSYFFLCIAAIAVLTDYPFKIKFHIIDISDSDDDFDDVMDNEVEEVIYLGKGKGKDDEDARKSTPSTSKSAPYTPKPLPGPYTPLRGITKAPSPHSRKQSKCLFISHTVTPLTPLSHNCTV